MLQVKIPEFEYFDERTNEFHTVHETTLRLEHSLVSLSKWESKWKKPFLGKGEKTIEECRDYVRCMTITQNVNPLIYKFLPNGVMKAVNDYIEDSMTATWFSKDENRRHSNEVVTAEIIYYWMVALNIPFECQNWHLNRLITLIRVCNIKNAPQKKLTRSEVLDRNRALNMARRQSMHSRG